ncbi:uncharacterized protein EDB91DRAFT_1164267 [Suillus paluster]|uniref:uncharacterized protein n=1 Tax=Suillus paluster TaxID=48578 RepID=UPI001B867B14|nr:uncharacterized protein EDB91DRAFT_1164267 [Suillus paluster]KAG1727263.1 hypothetical protein EDB91DRAFT_1164267 [Suillus paluster]
MNSRNHQPRWKRMIAMKKSSIPSISLVFGEAQQVSSSQTAAEKLPQILRKASPNSTCSISEARSEQSLEEIPVSASVDQPAIAHEAGQLDVPTTRAQCASLLAAEGSHPIPTPPSKSDMTVVQSGASAVSVDSTAPVSSDPSDPLPRDISVATSSQKSSWFASWTRGKGEGLPDSGVETTRRPTSVQASGKGSSMFSETVHSETPTVSLVSKLPILSITEDGQPVRESIPTPTLPQDIPTRLHSNYPLTTSPHSASYSSSSSPAAHHSRPGTAPTPSPLDEDVPKLPPAKLSPASPSTVLRSGDASHSTLTLNHSTSRFTLSIPLLGRPKLPLEQTVAAAQLDDNRNMTLQADSSLPCKQQSSTQESIPLATERPSAAVTETTEVNVTANVIAQLEEKGTAGATEATNAQTDTWWSYLGWGGTRPSGAQPHESEIEIENAPTISVVPDALPLPVGEMVPQPTVDSETVVPQKSEDGTEEQIASQEAPSVLSADASGSQGSAWYSPWSWYQTSSTPVILTSSPSDTQAVTGGEGNVQPELNKDDELLTHATSAVPPSPEPQVPASEANPISSTITNNRSGWISFFSARAVAMKSITNESHNKEMEVMDLDEDEASLTVGPPSSATCSIPLNKEVNSPSPGLTSVPPVTPPSSSPAQKPEDKSTTNGSANISDAVRRGAKRPPSPTPSKKSGVKTPTVPPPPNLVLPTWEDTFHTQPRAYVPAQPPSALSKTFQYVSEVLFARDETVTHKKGKGKARDRPMEPYEKALPRSWDVIGGQEQQDVLRGCQRAVVIGVHGWFPGAVMRTVIGEPTGTSSKFVNMAVQALEEFQDKHNVKLSKITKIPLEGEGTISRRVDKLYQNLIGNKEWMDDLQNADVIFFATHSQGSIVSTHILDRLIAEGHIRTAARDLVAAAVELASGSTSVALPPQRVCCLALCGIHLGPLRYLSTSSLVLPYIQYFESIAARELFEFQNTDSQISRDYVKALGNVLDNGVKMVYIASLNDQVVGLYSGLFTSVTHPLILRALYIDGDAYHSSDFLSNLLVLLLRIRNAGLSDGGLLTHLSEATAGSLNGVGHSTAYEETATYSFAISYLFLSDSGQQPQVELAMEPFDARTEQNDYEIPWALRDLIADDRVAELFSDDFIRLRDAFRDWQPKTAILRDVKRKLQPIQRLSSTMIFRHAESMSKL